MIEAVPRGGNTIGGSTRLWDGGDSDEDIMSIIDQLNSTMRISARGCEIRAIPTHKFSRSSNQHGNAQSSTAGSSSSSGGPVEENEEHPECSICVEEYEEDESLKRLPCGHMFHSKCIDAWLERNRTCPYCRRSIRNGDSESISP